jgi:hypothetical protein
MKTGKLVSLGVAVVVLLGLTGTLYWSSHHPKPSPETPLASGPVILKLDPASVTELSLNVKDAAPISLVKQGDKWQITAPEKIPADSDEVSGLLQELDPLNAQELVATNVTDLKQYGFDHPAISLNIVEKGHAPQQLLIGDDTPVAGYAYAMMDGTGRVYTTPMEKKNVLKKNLTLLREKRLVTASTNQMQQVELTHAGQTVTLTHDASGWRMLQPAPFRVDQFAVESLADTLNEAEMDLNQPAPQEAEADWAHGTPVGSVKISGSAGTQTLAIRNYKDEDYAKSSLVNGVFHVGAPLADALDKTAASFRNKQVFDFGSDEPDALDLQLKNTHGGAVNLALKHNALGWWQNGKKVNTDKAESLVSALRALTAVKFINSGFTKPDISVSVTSQSGKHQETVDIAKSGSNYLARRIDDPSLYVLDGGAVEGMESAARQLAGAGGK